MIDACGTEQFNEFVIIRSGGGFNTSDIELDYDANNNILSPVNNDINIDNNNWPADPTPCGLATGNTAAFSGCPNLIAVGPGVDIPANAIVVLQNSANSQNNTYNFSSLCGAGQCIYVIASSCIRSAGGFTNGPAGGTRITNFSIAGTCLQTITYNLASTTGGNGAYYLPLTNIYGNAGCVVPPVTGPTLLPPNITPIPNVTVCGDYILPAITGTNLTGNQAYYTGPNGTGTQFNPGDVISATTTLYAFDQNGPVGCTDQEQFTVTIGTAPTVNQPADVTVCATQNIVVPITGSPGAMFPWTNDNTATGLATTGTGSINTPSANVAMPEVSMITVTPTQAGCMGAPVTFNVTVNPRPAVDDPPNQVLCGGEQIVVNFTGSGANPTYNWTNNNPAIGVQASGNGDIDVPANNVSAAVTGTITVTASENGCTGPSQTFTVTVNPTPTVNTPADITVCGGQSVGVTITGSTNTTFNWTNDNPAIGLGASGSGNINFPAAVVSNTEVANITITPTHNVSGCDGTPVTFTITVNPGPTVDNPGNLTFCGGEFVLIDLMSPTNPVLNWTNSNTAIGLTATNGSGDINFNAANVVNTQVGTITVTPMENNCTGPAEMFTITVNPAPFVAQPNNVTVCGGQTVTVNFTGSAGATFNWTNDNPAIGLMDSGTGGFTFTSLASGVTEVATITVTPNNGFCDGAARTFTITVNPTPVMNPPANITVCGTQPINVAFSPNTATYTWTNSNVLTGLPAFGNGNINTPAANVTSTQTGTVTVTPNENGCPGPTTSFMVTVQQAPTVNQPGNIAICSGQSILINFSGSAGAIFNWTNSNTAIGNIGASGAGNISLTAASVATQQVGTITVTPSNGSCNGQSVQFTITINPLPTITQPANVSVCNGDSVAVNFTGSAGATFSWTNNNTAIGLAASGTGNLKFLTAAVSTQQVATITVTPKMGNNCNGIPVTFTVTVNPGVSVNNPGNRSACVGDSVHVLFTGTGNPLFTWTNDNPLIGLGGSGTGDLHFLAANVAAPQTATITVTPLSPTGFAYIANTTTDNVSVIDLVTNTVVATIPVGDGPRGVGISPDGQFVYVTNASSNNVSVINTSTNTVVATIPVGTAPLGVAVSPDGQHVYVTNTTANTVSVIDAATNTVFATIGPISQPYGIIFSPDGARVYVTSHGSGNVAVIDPATNTILTTIATGNGPYGITLSPDGNLIYVTNLFSNTVSVINATTNTVVATIPVGNSPIGVSISPDGSRVYVANQASNTVTVINAATNTIIATIPVGSNPMGLSLSPSGSFLYVTNFINGNVSVINVASNTVVNTVNVGQGPIAFGNFTTTGASACTGTPQTFTITVGPTPVIAKPNDATACGNATVNVAFNPPPGVTVNWTNSNPAIGLPVSGSGNSLMFPAANVATPQTATITATPVLGTCSGAPVSFTITVNPRANGNIAGDLLLCAGDSSILTASGGGTYEWDNGDTTAAITVMPMTPTSFTVIITNSFGCATAVSALVDVDEAPVAAIAGTTALCAGESTTLSASGGTAGYTWSTMTNTSAITVTPAATTTYTVTVTNAFSCTATSSATVLVNQPDSLNIALVSCNPADTGTVVQLLQNQFGCDSIIVAVTTLAPSDAVNLTASTCDPNSAGTFTQNLTNQFGCDSIVTTIVTFDPAAIDTTVLAATTTCDPSQAGTFTQSLTNQFGCDSIVISNVTLIPADTVNLTAATCDPNQAGVFTQNLFNQFGCDSTVTTTVTLLPTDTVYQTASTCNPNQAGTFTQNLTNQAGCDSTVVTTVTYDPAAIDTTVLAATTCDPSQVGATQALFNGSDGCDSLVITNTTLLPADTVAVAQTTCDPSQAGTFTQSLTNQLGCDSIVITTVTLLPTDTVYQTASTCDPSQAGVFTQNLVNQFGCDSIVMTTVTLTPADTVYQTASTCNPNQAGVFTQNLSNQFGCDSIVVTTVTLTPADTVYQTASTCDPSQTGVFTQNLVNQFGCDSIVTTTVTQLPVDTVYQTASTCDPNQAGVFTQNLTNQFGCDSTVITTVTLLPSDTKQFTLFTCDSSSAGVTTQHLTNQFGCDSTVIITAVFDPSLIDITFLTATTCDPTQAGTVQTTLTGADGCDSIIVLTTDLLPSDTMTLVAFTCDPATAGVFIQTLQNQYGCDSLLISEVIFDPFPCAPSVSATGTNVSCGGFADGSFILSILNGQVPLRYDWAGSSGGNGTGQITDLTVPVVVENLPAGTYTITITDLNNQASTTATIILSEPPVLSGSADAVLAFNGFAISCSDATDGTVNSIVSGGAAPFDYEWSNGGDTPVLAGVGAGTYTLTVTDDNGCSTVSSATVTAPPPISFALDVAPAMCGDSVVEAAIIAGGGLAPYSIVVDGNPIAGTTPALGPGTHLIALTDANGCSADSTVTLDFPPAPQLFLSPDTSVVIGHPVRIEATTNLSAWNSLVWQPLPDSSCADCLIQEWMPRQSGIITATIVDTFGCSASASIRVLVERVIELYIPNVFSPNDDGFNDLWQINAGQSVLDLQEVQVFDRWGDLQYQWLNPVPANTWPGWDGITRGKKAGPGVYVYYVKVKLADGSTTTVKGDVTITRY